MIRGRAEHSERMDYSQEELREMEELHFGGHS